MSSNDTTTSKETSSKSIMFINLLVPPILVILGVTFNTFTIMTMRTRNFRKVSTSVYLKVGAINDALALMVSLVAHWLYVNFPGVYVRTDSSHIMCKFFNFYGSGNNDFGIIVTVSMTAERALVIASPLSAAQKCSVKRAWKVVFILLFSVILKNVHFLIASDIVPAGRTDRLCDVFVDNHGSAYKVFYMDIHPWIHLCYVISCAIAIIISNSIILHNVRKSFGVKQSRKHQAWRHFVPMLLGESLLLVVFTFPFTLHLALLSIRLKYDPGLYSDGETAAMENLVFSITFYMLYSNKCVNFFMYCITGKQFRDGLVTVLMRCACQDDDQGYFKRSTKFRSTTSSTMSLSGTKSRLSLSKDMSGSKSRLSLSKDAKTAPSKRVVDKCRKPVKGMSASERLKKSLTKKRRTNLHTHADSMDVAPSSDLNGDVSLQVKASQERSPVSALESRNEQTSTPTENKPPNISDANKKGPRIREVVSSKNSLESTISTISMCSLSTISSDKQCFVPSYRKPFVSRTAKLTKYTKDDAIQNRFLPTTSRLKVSRHTRDNVSLYVERRVVTRRFEMIEPTQASFSVYV